MSLYYKLDKNNKVIPCSLMEWAKFLEDGKNTRRKIVKQSEINDKWISTVFIGLDHQWMEDGPLHIFETMVFDSKKCGKDIYLDRYSTWNEALLGHEKAIQWVKDGCKN
jgi:hypothetical protein